MTASSETLTPWPPGEEPLPRAAGGGRWARGIRVLVAVTALWALFIALNRLLSGRWWVWLLPDLVPPLLFLVVPALLLVLAAPARPVRRWLVPALALLLLAGAPRAGIHWGALVPGGGPRASAGESLKVFSWNTEYWDTADDPDAFYRYLKRQRADVYLLQEYLAWENESPRQIDETARLRKEFPGYHIVVFGELVTLSRHRVVVSPRFGRAAGLDADTPWQQQFERGKILRTDLDVRGQVISVYNVHIPVQLDVHRSMLSGGFYRIVRERDAARRADYAALERDARGNTNPLLVSGDFNTTPAMGDLRGMRNAFDDAISASDALTPGTWPSGSLALWRLDWAFTNRQLRVDRYEIGNPAGMSDHRPQTMLVSLAR